jgi:hypothetical protein
MKIRRVLAMNVCTIASLPRNEPRRLLATELCQNPGLQVIITSRLRRQIPRTMVDGWGESQLLDLLDTS